MAKNTNLEIDIVEFKRLVLEENYTPKELMDFFGISSSSVYRILNKEDLPVVNKRVYERKIDEVECVEMINKGIVYSKISDIFGVSPQAVYKIASKYGLSSKKFKSYDRNLISANEMKSYVKKGMNVSDISRETGHDRKTIRKYADGYGIVLEGQKSKNPDCDELKYYRIDKNFSREDLADRYNVSVNTIKKWLKKHGIRKGDYK